MKKSRSIFIPTSYSRQQHRRKRVFLAAGLGLLALISGTTLLQARSDNGFGQLTNLNPFQFQSEDNESSILNLVSLPAAERATELEAIASGSASTNQSRARYLLASDLIEQNQGDRALSLLEGLETKYKVLAPYVLLKRSQAYAVNGQNAQAIATLRELTEKYPDSPVAAEALYTLGKEDNKLWDEAIAKFPSHPRTLEMVQQRLKENPNQSELMLVLARYAPDTPGITSVLDRLVNQSATNLEAEDWEAIASIYWQKQEYGKASSAYMATAETPENAYMVAQALNKSGSKGEAITAYEYVVTEFPTAKEAANSLFQLANLSQTPEALAYLDRVISQHPDRAGDALAEKVKIYEELEDTAAAQQARQLLLTQYNNSEGASEYRWTQAQASAAAGNHQNAWEWAKPIAHENPNSRFGPRAAFWAGRWAQSLGKQDEARNAFERAIAQYPQSYYAWRSAVFLGWDVGDFDSVRDKIPQIIRPQARSPLPAGSDTLKELYQLGQDRDAWTLWQAEFQNRRQPSVAEQFTEGLMRLAIGKNLSGIGLVAKLEDRETPQEQAEFDSFKQDMTYWHALYPFPYMDLIEPWSKERQINPLLVTALIRQESKFEPAIRSIAGASGLMQIMPATAAAQAKEINLSPYSLENPKDNIKLGTSYFDTTHRYYDNNSMLAVASYNAGPGNVSKWLKERGHLDADEFVESIPFSETNFYVKNVFGNYWNYLRLYNPEISQKLAQHKTTQRTARR